MAQKGYRRTIYIDMDYNAVKDGAAAVQRQMKLLDNEFRSTSEAMKLSGSENDKLANKQDYLTRKIELQTRKVEELYKKYEEAKTKGDEHSKSVMDAANKYNYAESELEKLKNQLTETNAQIEKLGSGSKLGKISTDIENFKNKAEDAGVDLQNLGDNMQKVGVAWTAGITIPLAIGAAKSVEAAKNFEDAFTGVIKTVDGTEQQLEALKEGFLNMSKVMPVSASALAEIGEAAGQLGIHIDNIEGFTRVMADLGVSTNLSATEAAESLAQFANITRMSQNNFDRLGSSIVALGNNMATTERDIVNFGQRLAGAGNQVGMSEDRIMATAAAFSSLGIEAEMGGTAVSKVLLDMSMAAAEGGESLKGFAQIAGMSGRQFKDAFEKDAAAAFQAFLAGLNKIKENGGNTAAVIEDLGYKEVRVRDTLLRGSAAHELYAEALQISADAWEENTALAKEAETRYGTFSSKLEILKNNLEYILIKVGEPIMDLLSGFISIAMPIATAIGMIADVFNKLPEPLQRIILLIMALVAIIGPLLTIAGTFLKKIDDVGGGFGKAGKAAKDFAEIVKGLNNPIAKAVAVVMTLVTALIILAALWAAITGKEFAVSKIVNDAGKMTGDINKQTQTLQSQPRYAYEPIKGKATGTNNWEGGPVRVHEKGGEIIDLPTGTRIYPADKSKQMMQDLANSKQQVINNYNIELDLSKFRTFKEMEAFFQTFPQSQRQTEFGV